MESNDIFYAGSNFNKEAIRKWERAQFVEHLRSQLMPDIPFSDLERREKEAGDLWDLCQPIEIISKADMEEIMSLPDKLLKLMADEISKEDADSETIVGEVAKHGNKPKRNNGRNN